SKRKLSLFHHQIAVTQSARADADQNFVGSWGRALVFLDFDRATSCFNDRCSHDYVFDFFGSFCLSSSTHSKRSPFFSAWARTWSGRNFIVALERWRVSCRRGGGCKEFSFHLGTSVHSQIRRARQSVVEHCFHLDP